MLNVMESLIHNDVKSSDQLYSIPLCDKVVYEFQDTSKMQNIKYHTDATVPKSYQQSNR